MTAAAAKEVLNKLISACGIQTALALEAPDERIVSLLSAPNRARLEWVTDLPAHSEPSLLSLAVPEGTYYDLIYISALRSEVETLREVNAALQFLSSNGIVAIFFRLPQNDADATARVGTRSGWRAVARIRMERADLKVLTVLLDQETALTLVQRGAQVVFPNQHLISKYALDPTLRAIVLNIVPEPSIEPLLKPEDA